MKVLVDFGQFSGDPLAFEVTRPPSDRLGSQARVRFTTAVLCQVKQQITDLTSHNPWNFSLNLADSVPNDLDLGRALVSLNPPLLVARQRQETRVESATVMVSGYFDAPVPIAVSPNDTILDLRFKVARYLGYPDPSHIHFIRQLLVPLNDDFQSLSDADVLFDSDRERATSVKYWFEKVDWSKGDGNEFIVQSVPRVFGNDPSISTLGQYIRISFDRNKDREIYGVRQYLDGGKRGKYQFQNGKQIMETLNDLSRGLIAMGLKPGSQTRIGVCMETRPEWLMSDYSAQLQGMVTVPLYRTLDHNAVEYIVNHAEVSCVFCSVTSLPLILKAQSICDTLKYVILVDTQKPDLDWFQKNSENNARLIKNDDTRVIKFSELVNLGRKNQGRIAEYYDESKPDDLCGLYYTSGTTGNPKGVMYTHRQSMAMVHSCIRDGTIESMMDGTQDEQTNTYCWLPLAHVMGKLGELISLYFGTKNHFWSCDLTKLIEDIQLAQPKYLVAPPRLYERFQLKIMSLVENGTIVDSKKFNHAYQVKKEAMEQGKTIPLWCDNEVFSRIRSIFGGKIESLISGGAPLSADLQQWLVIVLANDARSGYGLTETLAAGTRAHKLDVLTFGHQGCVGSNIELKLVSTDNNDNDLDYHLTDEPNPRGEVYLRGPTIFKGYYKEPLKTLKVLNYNDGWFATGDIAIWRADGKLEICDRAKHIFKLSQGEYVRPTLLEGLLKQSKFISNAFVYGDSQQSYLLAFIVPDPMMVVIFAHRIGLINPLELKVPMNGVFNSDNNKNDDLMKYHKLLQSKPVMALIRKEIDIIVKKNDLNHFENPKKIKLISDDFTPESGLLTASFKLKRGAAQKYFRKDIDEMYGNHATLSKL